MRSLPLVIVLIACLSFSELSLGSDEIDLCRKNITAISSTTDLIAQAPSDTDYVKLCENNITTIEPSAFEKFSDLEKLFLDSNELLKFPSGGGSFIRQHSLTDLSCFRCGVDKIYNRSLVEIPRLERINLTENKIEQIEEEAFQSNQNLKVIDLRSNFLRSVPRGLIEKLTRMYKIDLSFNGNLSAEDNQPFMISNSLVELWCDDCGFQTVYENTFSRLFNLKLLHLRNNKITVVHAWAFFQVTRWQPGNTLMVSLENNKLQNIGTEIKDGLQLCLYNNTEQLECFLRNLPDKDNFICSNSTQPDIECIPSTTTTTTTTITTTTTESPEIPDTTPITNNKADTNEPRQATSNPTIRPTPPPVKPVDKPPEEVYGISDAYISGYLTLIYVAQIGTLVLLIIVWLKLKKSDLEIDRYSECILNPSPNYKAIQ
ncbi:hypothetical protein RP20_CCG010550 [Aedes albopictus]|nr:hypothetical protein RP20_CCG010550 [Aedes albopictus]